MGLFSKKKNEEVAIDELTPQIKTKLDELALFLFLSIPQRYYITRD